MARFRKCMRRIFGRPSSKKSIVRNERPVDSSLRVVHFVDVGKGLAEVAMKNNRKELHNSKGLRKFAAKS